jgi:hypothetical protein
MPCIVEFQDGVRIRVRLHPQASKDSVGEVVDGHLRIRLTAPPVEDRANEALRAFLAKRLRIAKGAVRLIRGGHSRNKTLEVLGVNADVARSKLIGADARTGI